MAAWLRRVARAMAGSGAGLAAADVRLKQLQQTADDLAMTMAQLAYRTELQNNPRYAEAKRVVQFGWKGFSQNDEDGIVAEILRRTGEESRQFIELGVGNGLENNTCYLLLKGWRGAWVDADASNCAQIRAKFAVALQSGALRLHEGMVTSENVEKIIGSVGLRAVDVLSIDIDGNDYWVWKAIEAISPRVVTIEYNAKYGRDEEVLIPYDPTFTWKVGSSYMGCSLKALEVLGKRKGYSLVGCNFVGVNAFFVRDDLVNDLFALPYSAENHFEPARYHLRLSSGHRSDFGPFVRDHPSSGEQQMGAGKK